MDLNIENSGIDPETVYSFLQKHELFNQLLPNDLKALAAYFEVVFVSGGTLLMEEGKPGDDLFLVLNGRLSVYRTEDKEDKVVAELGAGDVVGEIGLLIDKPRTANVKAIRDSVLLKLNKKVFDVFSKTNSIVSLEIAKTCIKRLIHPNKKVQGQIKTIALVPIGKSQIIQEFIHRLSKERTNSLILDRALIDKKFTVFEKNQYLTSWLNEKEFHYEFIYYVADDQDTPWTQLCMRQADCIYFLCDANETRVIKNEEYKINTHKYLFLLHSQRDQGYKGTADWLSYTKLNDSFHLVVSDPNDIKRAIRIMTGKSIGLVLSGGGARGAAHIGLLRAMAELNIPIDIIGGTSIGGIIAALYSIGYDYKNLAEKYHEIIVPGSKLDYTFPYVSFATGKNLVKALKKYAGENQLIEDLWTRFFCISSNITLNTENVHRTGLLWRALRATASLPGAYPPLFDDVGLLVDGGYLDNLPVEVMKNQLRAGKVIGSLITVSSETQECSVRGETFSGWEVLLNKLNIFEENVLKVPRIDTILMRSMNVNDYDRQLTQAEKADLCVYLDMNEFGLMDYDRYKQMIQKGYEQALKQLKVFAN